MDVPAPVMIWSVSISVSIMVIPTLLYLNYKSIRQKSRFVKIFAIFNFFEVIAQITVYFIKDYNVQSILSMIFTFQLLLLFFIGNKHYAVLKLLEEDYPLSGTPFGRIIGIAVGSMLIVCYSVNFIYPGPDDLQFITILVWTLLIMVLDYSQGLLLLNVSLDDHVASKIGTKNVGLILVVVLSKPLYVFSLGFFVLHYFFIQGYLGLAINFAGIQMIISEEICLNQEIATIARESGEVSDIAMESGLGGRLRSLSTTTVVVN